MNEYKINDNVWIHIGEPSLVVGRVVHVFMLPHDQQKYVIELSTHIEPVYEVREWETISSDATGPINMFRKLKTEHRYLKKLGLKTTQCQSDPIEDGEPTDAQINEALHRTEQSTKHVGMTQLAKPATKSRRRPFKKSKE